MRALHIPWRENGFSFEDSPAFMALCFGRILLSGAKFKTGDKPLRMILRNPHPHACLIPSFSRFNGLPEQRKFWLMLARSKPDRAKAVYQRVDSVVFICEWGVNFLSSAD